MSGLLFRRRGRDRRYCWRGGRVPGRLGTDGFQDGINGRVALAVLRAVRDQAVLILGARQVGKTTLARAAFPKAAYCDLEDPTLRHLFTEEPVFQRKFQEKKKQKQ